MFVAVIVSPLIAMIDAGHKLSSLYDSHIALSNIFVSSSIFNFDTKSRIRQTVVVLFLNSLPLRHGHRVPHEFGSLDLSPPPKGPHPLLALSWG